MTTATDPAGYSLGPISDGGMDPRNGALADAPITRRFAEHLASEIIGGTCELTGDGTNGACDQAAVAVRWEHGFADSVCQHHAETALARGAEVVFAKRHNGED